MRVSLSGMNTHPLGYVSSGKGSNNLPRSSYTHAQRCYPLLLMCLIQRGTSFLLALIAWAVAVYAADPRTPPRQVAGIKQPVGILVDKWGVPHIYAKDFGDGFFAQRFNPARDRLFQIELWRR